MIPSAKIATLFVLAVALHPGAQASTVHPDAQAPSCAKRLVVGDVPPHTTGAFRPFVLPGEIDEGDGFVELRQGRTMTVWCPERIAREDQSKLAAAKRFVESPFLPVGSVSVAYVGDASGARVLEALGVRFTAHGARSLPDPAQTQLIALGPGVERDLRTPEETDAFRRRLAARTVLALPGADLSLLPFGLARERATLPGDAARPEAAPPHPPVPDLPVFAGIRRDFGEFLRLAGGTECDVVAGGPTWMLATSPACFAHLKNGSQSVIVMAVAPDDVPDGASRAALVRVWCTILANLNVETPARTPDGQPLP